MSILEFDPVRHRYKLDGSHAPGVTTVMGSGIPKPQLVRWAAKEVALEVERNFEQVAASRHSPDFVKNLAGAPDRTRDRAALRGTEIHAIAEKVAKGEPVEVPPEHHAEVMGYVKWLDEWDVTALSAERPCFSRSPRWCGTYDILFTSPHINDGKPVMGDVKTSRKVYGDTAIQTGVYSRAEGFIDENGDVQPMPEITFTGVMHVTAEGTQFHPLNVSADEIDESYAWFEAAYTTYANATKRKNRLRPPLELPLETPTAFYDTLKKDDTA